MGGGEPPVPPAGFTRLAIGFIVAGVILAALGLLLYAVFLGVLFVPGVGADHVAALTNLVVVTIGVGLVCTGVAIRLGWEPG